MSCRDILWAIDQGRSRALSTAERMVLITLADRANGARLCWPSMRCISADTGLSERQVRTIVHRLADKAHRLIRLELRGRSMHYHILRANDDDGTETEGDEHRQPLPVSDVIEAPIAATTAAVDTGNAEQHRQPLPDNTGNFVQTTPEPVAAKPTKKNLSRNLRRAPAREAQAFEDSRIEGKQSKQVADRGGASPPVASLDALDLPAAERANVIVWMRHQASGDLEPADLTNRLSFIRLRYRETGYRWLSEHVPAAAAIAAAKGWYDSRVGASP